MIITSPVMLAKFIGWVIYGSLEEILIFCQNFMNKIRATRRKHIHFWGIFSASTLPPTDSRGKLKIFKSLYDRRIVSPRKNEGKIFTASHNFGSGGNASFSVFFQSTWQWTNGSVELHDIFPLNLGLFFSIAILVIPPWLHVQKSIPSFGCLRFPSLKKVVFGCEFLLKS